MAVLAIGICATLAGARSYVAIAEWAAELPAWLRLRLGTGRLVPCEATIRRVLQAVDPGELDTALSGWLAGRRPGPHPVVGPGRTGQPVRPGLSGQVAIDGKTCRGARRADGPARHLLAALDVSSGGVLAQVQVDGKSNEISAFPLLLDRLDLTGTLVSADAMHTQRGHADAIVSRGGHYLFTVKANQPRLHRQLRELPWTQVPVVDAVTGKGHGRIEKRTLQLTLVDAGIGFPHARLAAKVTRRRRPVRSACWQTETVYLVTDLDYPQVTAEQFADAARGHWHIENRLHWVRDVTFDEDRSQVRTGNGPTVMACLRNFAISAHRRSGQTNIAAATRKTNRDPLRALHMIR